LFSTSSATIGDICGSTCTKTHQTSTLAARTEKVYYQESDRPVSFFSQHRLIGGNPRRHRARMAKGTETRERILSQVAPLFNQRGFSGAAMSDVMAATGLEKGGIYRHFESKEALALAAFDFAAAEMARHMMDAVQGHQRTTDRLIALLSLWERVAVDPPIAGGCPVMNTAIENDDSNPALRDRARHAMSRLHKWLRLMIGEGIETGELRPDVDPAALASVLLSTLEGALMLSRLYRDPVHMQRATQHLTSVVQAAAA
jgi:TetR/AcrR family transcriptional regulator, transcriptional repressor for nem operon